MCNTTLMVKTVNGEYHTWWVDDQRNLWKFKSANLTQSFLKAKLIGKNYKKA